MNSKPNQKKEGEGEGGLSVVCPHRPEDVQRKRIARGDVSNQSPARPIGNVHVAVHADVSLAVSAFRIDVVVCGSQEIRSRANKTSEVWNTSKLGFSTGRRNRVVLGRRIERCQIHRNVKFACKGAQQHNSV